MSNTTTTTTTTTNANAKPSAVPTAKVFAGYVDDLVKAGAEVEKAAAKIALAATRQAAHRSSLTYLNAAYAAFKTCHLTCLPQLMRYALGALGGLMTADDKGNPMVSRSKSILRITDARERKANGGDAFAWAVEPKTSQAKEELARARRALAHPDFTNFLTAPTAAAKYAKEDGLTASERELMALLNWARRNSKASTAKRAGERGYNDLQDALKIVKSMFKEFDEE